MGGEDADKIIRIAGDTLLIKVTPEEVKYRDKYLPDPTKLTDEKLVCTVCSVSLAQDIHKGKDIFIHRSLQVLVCEACFTFYGDGCFSADEDGDDKYCRWCGQGGTLFLCSTCNCAFCQKCVKLNLKASVLADLENDDWKCYICNPRPLFGSRAICWGAEELNKIGKEKEKEKLKKQKEKLEKREEKKKEETGRKSRKQSSSEVDEVLQKKRKRGNGSDSSSPEVMPTKRPRRTSLETRNLNGSLNRSRRKRKDSSSDDSSQDDKRVLRRSRSQNKRNAAGSSSDDSNFKNQRKRNYKKKKGKNSSDESSAEDHKMSKRRSIKKSVDSSDDELIDQKKTKKKKLKKHKEESSDESSDDNKKRQRKLRKIKNKSSDSESNDSSKKDKKKSKFKKDDKKKSDIYCDDDEDIKEEKNNEEMVPSERPEEIRSKDGTSSVDNLVKKRIKLAILWLDTAMKDIAELGGLISTRATKFANKKINSENLKSYDDVLNTVSKLKQLISGIHSNYDHIEKNLDNQLKPWKILTGIEESETDKPIEDETKISASGIVNERLSEDSHDNKNNQKQVVPSISSTDKLSSTLEVQESTETCKEKIQTKTDSEVNFELAWDNLSGDEDSEDDNRNMTEAITKASESLDKLDEQEDLNASNNCKDPETSAIDNRNEEVVKIVEDLDKSAIGDIFDSNLRQSQNESEQQHSVTDEEKPKQNDYTSPLETSNSEKNVKHTKDIEENNVNKFEPANSVTEGSDNDSELLHKKEKPLHSCLEKEKKEKNGEDTKNNELDESPRKDLKETGEYAGIPESNLGGDNNYIVEASSSDSTGLESFGNKLKEKWLSVRNPNSMKLKTKLGLDSSDDSDTSFEPAFSKKDKVLKKKIDNDDESSTESKKLKHKAEKKHVDHKNDKKRNSIQNKKSKKRKSKTSKQTTNKAVDDCSDEATIENECKGSKEEIQEISDFDELKDSPGEDIDSDGKLGKKTVKIEKDIPDIKTVASTETTETLKVTDVMTHKLIGLDTSSEENNKLKSENESNSGLKSKTNSKGKEKKLKKKSVRNQERFKKMNMLESSDEDNDEGNDHSDVKENNVQMSSDEEKPECKEENDKESSSPIELLSSDESSDLDLVPKKKGKRKNTEPSDSDEAEATKNKKTKKRKLIRCANSDESGEENLDASQKSNLGESPGKGGRKNIKKIKGKGDLEDATIEAAEEEKERRKRVEERQKRFNEIFEIKETKILDKLVLDFDEKEKKELISVHKDLVEKMKPHQAKGVKFMWDSCFETLAQLKKKKGSGCILAHCMGLGKTFQVISLAHTLLTHEEETRIRTIMVVCPLSTVLNWYNEFDKWLEGIEGGDSIEVFHLTKCKLNPERARELRRWQHNGGVMIMGYEMFRNLTCETAKKFKGKMKKDFQETLVDPGADLIVCDEGHMLKNETTALSKAMSRVKTLRRIVLTGTPMQNNLKEYHCMVQFVKPNLLGTRKEFLNRFVNPISNGQFVDSTDSDVKLMKRRAHVLHKMLEGLVQRFDYNVLTPFLPPKHEFVVSLCLSELQVKLYKHYLENYSQQSDSNKAGSRLFQDWQALGRVWTHPRVLKMSTDKANLLKEKKMMEESDEEGSLKDFIDDDSEKETTTEESSDNSSNEGSVKSYDGNKKKTVRNTRNTRATRSSAKKFTHLDSSEEEKEDNEEPLEESVTDKAWWSEMVEPEHLDDINQSAKLVLLFAILKECEMIEDKVLVFSQSLFSLDLIEYFLDKIDTATQENRLEESLGNHQGNWSKGLDYFRLDGSTSSENRNIWCKAFNREDNTRARLFLISTRAGGLGINLTAANRVIIFDASWNPSHDVQSIFRVYRFGQKKPCYVYRFIAHGTMEEKVYDRQVAKQSMSNRVVDEQQVHRHFSMNDLNELYSFTPPTNKEDRPTPALPKDGLMAEILSQYKDWIEKYHEHDSLLENVVEEELNEEERKAAWEDYENDKKRGFIPPTTGAAPGTFNNPMSLQIENMRRSLKLKYPTKPENELNQLLVYEVSMLMLRQQQMAATGQMGMNAPRPQMYPTNNLSPEQLFNLQQQQFRMQYLQQLQMNQNQQHATAANLRNILPKQPDYQQQMLMQHQTNLARSQMQPNMSLLKTQPHLSKLLQSPLMAHGGAAAQFERRSQNYPVSKKPESSVKIMELSSKPDETKTKPSI